uniref:Transmembrane protein n=1 Tax=Manihot esculenta TaxID=3983 RepID=A0A2C9WFT7_MANES
MQNNTRNIGNGRQRNHRCAIAKIGDSTSKHEGSSQYERRVMRRDHICLASPFSWQMISLQCFPFLLSFFFFLLFFFLYRRPSRFCVELSAYVHIKKQEQKKCQMDSVRDVN